MRKARGFSTLLAAGLVLGLACGGIPGGDDCAELLRCGERCVNELLDPQNCGACGNVCEPGTTCIEGECGSPCSMGLSACAGACVDLSSSAEHCGACDSPCDSGQTCADGRCG